MTAAVKTANKICSTIKPYLSDTCAFGRRYPVNGIFAYQNKTADKMCGKSVEIIWFHYFSCHPSCGYNER